MINFVIIRLYFRANDWAGLGIKHRMVAWSWRGIPRSLVF